MRLEVCGRLCLFGEHSDWAGGYRAGRPELARGHCLASGTDQGILAEVEPLDGFFEIRSATHPEAGAVRIRAEPRPLAEAAAGAGFYSYALGTAAQVASRHPVGGLRVEVIGADLPVRKGLSSSAAICVLIARAYNVICDLGLTERDEMEMAYLGERSIGSECGRMDQICALGRRPSFLTFDGEELHVEPLVPGSTFHLLIVDLRSTKDTRRILADLNRCFPDAPGPIAEGVREALGPRNAELVARARRALEAGDAPRLGRLMTEAQSSFDRRVAPASPELAAPRLHAVLDHPAVRELAFGGKGVGSQGDGCAQLLARGSEARERLKERLERDLGVRCYTLTLRPESAGRVPRAQASPSTKPATASRSPSGLSTITE